MAIIQNDEAKEWIEAGASYQINRDTLALVKILALSNQKIEVGKMKPIADVIARLKAKHASDY